MKYDAILDVLNDFIHSGGAPERIVSLVNDYISTDALSELSDDARVKIYNLQEAISFYVADPNRRKESALYFGDAEFRKIVEEFLRRE